jgi:hypothetical protein
MSTEQVYAEHGTVHACIADGMDSEHTDLTPEEAREHARELLAAADQADAQLAAIAAACAGGHDWRIRNSHPLDGDKYHVHSCRRAGCRERRVEDGWVPFEPKVHHTRWGDRDCYGPGCRYCETPLGRAAEVGR